MIQLTRSAQAMYSGVQLEAWDREDGWMNVGGTCWNVLLISIGALLAGKCIRSLRRVG
jgi:hypothetical protein